MASIFLSYAREDLGVARSLAGALERLGHSVWWDRHIKGATQFAVEIESALAAAEAVIVLWSKASIGSPWVRDEASAGRDTGRLVPASLDGALPPMGFRQYQSVCLSGWKGRRSSKRFVALVDALDGVLAGNGMREAEPPSAGTKQRRRLLRLAAVALLVFAAATVAYLVIPRPAPNQPISIALLPIAEGTRDSATRELALATRDSLSHTLAEGGFPVSLVTDEGKSRAAGLLVSGNVQTHDGSAQAIIRIEETSQRVIIYSHQFEAVGDDVKLLPERIGAQVAAALSWSGPLMALDRRNPTDPATTGEILRQMTLTVEGGDPLRAYEITRRVAPRAPDSAIAQLSLAMNTGFALGQLPRNERADAVAAGRRASERAKALAPDFGDVNIPWCLLHSPVRMVECEDRLRAGTRATGGQSFATFFLSIHLRNVGRLGEALELARLSLADDRYKLWKIALVLRALEIQGHSSEAERLFRQGNRWWPSHPALIGNRWEGMLARGDFDAIDRFESGLVPRLPPEERTYPELLAAVRNGNTAAAKKFCAERAPSGSMTCIVALARLGDLDGAFAKADQAFPQLRARSPAEEEKQWLDDPDPLPLILLSSAAGAPLRRDPRFLQIAERVGLLDYWRSGRLPDFCRGRPEPVCSKISRPSRQ